MLVVAGLAVSSCGGGGGDVSVATKEVPGYGKVLTTEEGKLLFVLTSDPKGSSKCADECAKEWPPLLGEGSAADGVDGGKLSSFKRADGDTQVLYNNHALYTYTGEELSGPGTKALGGKWFLISPDGDPVEWTVSGGY